MTNPQKGVVGGYVRGRGIQTDGYYKGYCSGSLCEFIIFAFFGKAHVAYIPNKYITD